jgi:hypothetical protein
MLIAFSQDTIKPVSRQKVVWITPVAKNTTINGMAIGFMAIPWIHADSLKINGLNAEISPFGFIAGIYALAGTFMSPFGRDTVDAGDLGSNKVFPTEDDWSATTIKGISVSFGGLVRNSKLSGVSINGITCFTNQTSGFEVTGVMNLHYSFRGLVVAGLRNKVTTGRGLQIALINTCKSGRVVQLGLINKIGKRVVPLINFSSGKS